MQILKKLGIFLCIMGLAISSYLFYIKVTGTEFVCGVSSCGIVNNSKYGLFLGIPVSAWGILFYFGMGSLLLLDFKKLFFFGSIGGVLFSAYLSYLETFVIRAWCQWCIISAWIALCLFILGLRAARQRRAAPK